LCAASVFLSCGAARYCLALDVFTAQRKIHIVVTIFALRNSKIKLKFAGFRAFSRNGSLTAATGGEKTKIREAQL